MKKIGIVLLVVCMILSNFAPVLAAEATPVHVTVDGKALTFDVPPAIINGRTLVPMRGIFEAFNVAVEWDGVNKVITGRKGNTVIVLPLESRMATKNDQPIMLDVPATVIEGRTLVPVRFIAESLGASVVWNSNTSTVAITSSGEKDEQAQQPTKKLTTSDIAKKANAVVTINNIGYIEDSFGSGFFISKDGKIVTNYHVIEDAKSLEIEFDDGTTYRGQVRVLGYDKEKDIAVLKIDGNNYPYLTMGDSSKEKLGNDIVAIGSPQGLKNTVSTGIISGFRDGIIQITAPVTSGSSGGPVLNYYGEVIGVTTAAYLLGGNLGFAVPINEVKGLDITKNMTLQAVHELEYNPMEGKVDYESYSYYLYSTASRFSIANYQYEIDFLDIHIEENEDNPDQLLLYYLLDTENVQELFRAYEAGYRDNIRDLFSEVAVDLEDYYQKDVLATIIFYGEGFANYPAAFYENAITSLETVIFDAKTATWTIIYPILQIKTNYGKENYSYTWFE